MTKKEHNLLDCLEAADVEEINRTIAMWTHIRDVVLLMKSAPVLRRDPVPAEPDFGVLSSTKVGAIQRAFREYGPDATNNVLKAAAQKHYRGHGSITSANVSTARYMMKKDAEPREEPPEEPPAQKTDVALPGSWAAAVKSILARLGPSKTSVICQELQKLPAFRDKKPTTIRRQLRKIKGKAGTAFSTTGEGPDCVWSEYDPWKGLITDQVE